MKILLMNPPFLRLQGIKFKPFYFQIGIGYLAGALKEANYDVKIYNPDIVKAIDNISKGKCKMSSQERLKNHQKYVDALSNEEHFVWKEIAQVLNEYKPDLVGIRVMSVTCASGHKVAELVKEYNKDCFVVMGGIHATVLPNEVLEDNNVDFVAIGEGERTLVELCNMIKDGEKDFEKIDGLGFRKDGKLCFNKQRELIQNLDELPFPARDTTYNPEYFGASEYGQMMTSRGCPFNCAFCNSAQLWGRKVRFRSVDNILEEIKLIYHKYGVRYIMFHDDSFTLDRDRVIELCKRLIRENLNLNFGCETRVDLIDEKLIKIMKRAGLSDIQFGLESGSQRILDLLHKGVTVEKIKEAIKLARKYKIKTGVFFMFGLPDESMEEINQTIKLMKEIKVSEMIYNIFTPYPGTELYERAKELGLIPKKMNWKLYSLLSPNNHFIKNVSKEEFSKVIWDVARIVDKQNSSILRKVELFNSKRDYYLKHPIRTSKKAFKYFLNLFLAKLKL